MDTNRGGSVASFHDQQTKTSKKGTTFKVKKNKKCRKSQKDQKKTAESSEKTQKGRGMTNVIALPFAAPVNQRLALDIRRVVGLLASKA
ncbi:hypothetical protein BH10CYA1_BH10CYA1_48550 [soil metagenome]